MKKIIKYIIVSLLLVLAGCEKEKPVKVSFLSETYAVKVGGTVDMAAQLVVENTDTKPAFSLSDTSVATVDESGVLTAVAKGETVLTATVEGVSANCVVNISEVEADKITLTAPETITADGSWVKISVSVEPEDYDNDNLEWSFTPSAEGMGFGSEKVNAGEYNIMVDTYVEGSSITIKVKDSNSDLSQTAVIAVAEAVVPADRISLAMPTELTEGEENQATITATVTPEEYDPKNLFWEFEPSSADLGFRYEKVSDTEYKVCFANYVPDGKVTVKVSDGLSEVFNQGVIKVLEKPAEGVIKLNLALETLSLNVGDEPVTLSVTYEPAGYDTSLFEWTSSDEKVVTVSAGVVTVVGEGEAVVKVKDTVSGKEDVCNVTVTVPVKDAQIKRIDISQTSLTMRVGEDAVQLTATCYDEEGKVVENYSGLVWSVDETSGNAVEVSQEGVVTAKNAGTALVYVRDSRNQYVYATCHVYVKAAEVKVEKISLQPSSKIIEIGEEFTLTALITPDNAENKTLTYASSDEAVATVTAEGKVKGVAVGEAVISATSAYGIKSECKVVVADEIWVYLSETEITMMVGDEKTITARITPENAPEQTAVWASSDESVATVASGVVTAVSEGTAVITAAANGRTAECKVNVESKPVDFTITLTPERSDVLTKGLMQDETVRFYASYTRKDDGKDYVPIVSEWKSSDKSVATVDQDGVVTAVCAEIEEAGFANGKKVYITHVADGKEKEVELVITKAMPKTIEIVEPLPSVDGQPLKIQHGETFTFSAKVYPTKANQAAKWMCGANGEIGFETGVFKAKHVGTVDVVALAYDNTEIRHTIYIEILPVDMASMTLSHNVLEMTPGDQAALSVSILPANASYQEVTWTSSDETVATVDRNGNVKAIAAGNAVITVRQEENDMTCTCNVTVNEPAPEKLAVGDYYYSDGTTSKTLDASKTVIGVVFSVNNPSQMGDSKLAADYPGCVNGYVVSLVEYTDQDFGNVSAYNGHGYYKDAGFDADAIVDEDKANGYMNTLAHAGLNSVKPDYVKLFNATDGVIATHAASVPSPATASAWYVPSYKEMQMMCENSEAVNAALSAAGGTALAQPYANESNDDPNHSSDWYWSSTICGTWYESGKSYDHSKYPFDLSRNGWTTYVQTFGKCKVRVILAF